MKTTGDAHGITHQGGRCGTDSHGAVAFGIGHGVLAYAKRANMWQLSFGLAMLLELSPEEMGAQKEPGPTSVDEVELKLYMDALRAGFDYRNVIITGNRGTLREHFVRWWSPTVLYQVISRVTVLSENGGGADHLLAGFWEASGTAWKLPNLNLVRLFTPDRGVRTSSLMEEKYTELRRLAYDEPANADEPQLRDGKERFRLTDGSK